MLIDSDEKMLDRAAFLNFFVDFVEFDFKFGGCRCERIEKYKSVSVVSRLIFDKISRFRGWVKKTVSNIKINT